MSFKSTTYGAILALAICGLVAHGLERNIQEVLEDRLVQLSNVTQESGTLPLIASVSLNSRSAPDTNEAKETPKADSVPETSTGHCTCKQDAEAAETPEPIVAPKKAEEVKVDGAPTKQKAKKSEKVEVVAESETADVDAEVDEQLSKAQESAEASDAAKLEKGADKEKEAADDSKLAKEEVKQKQRSGKKEKKGKGAEKRSKRDTKGSKGKNKNKRSTGGKSKESSKNKDKSKRSSDKKSRK